MRIQYLPISPFRESDRFPPSFHPLLMAKRRTSPTALKHVQSEMEKAEGWDEAKVSIFSL